MGEASYIAMMMVMVVVVLITMVMFGTFRSAVANSRGAVAGARDVGSKQGVAEKEHHTYDDDGDGGGDVNGDFDHGENYIDVDDVTHLNIRSAPGKAYSITTSVIIMVMTKMVTV